MRLVETAKRLETNAEVESQNFGIGDASVVIEILRNRLYRNKIQTLVQEYISNARDATREINGKKHIIVSLPTPFLPTFKVRDFGIGINPNRMATVFVLYGASTKRNTNNQTGGFGIGAKSAWAYTDSFTITTFIDGVQRQYLAHTGANNNGRLDFLGESPTKEENGTEIQVPVSPKDIRDFVKAAHRATHFWTKEEMPEFRGDDKTVAEVRVLGETIGQLELVTDIPLYVMGNEYNTVFISIDGIPYAINNTLIEKVSSLKSLTKLIKNNKLVFHIGNGQLEVSASREEISDSKLTLANLETIAANVLKQVNAKIVAEFSTVKSPFEHLSVYVKLSKHYDLSNYRKYGDFTMVADYNGDKIESDLFSHVKGERCLLNSGDSVHKLPLNKSSRRRRWSTSRPSISAKEFDRLFFVDGTESAVITNYRIRQFIRDNKVESVVVFSKSSEPTADASALQKLKTGLGLKDLTKVPYTKPLRKTPDMARIAKTKEEFTIHNIFRRNETTSLATNTQKYIYVEYKGGQDNLEFSELAAYLQEIGSPVRLCKLSKETIKKVAGDANFTSLDQYLKAFNPTAQQIIVEMYNVSKKYQLMVQLSMVTNIKNNFLTKMINIYKTLKAGPSLPNILKTKIKDVEEFKIQDAKLVQMIDTELSMLNDFRWSKTAQIEVVHYINAKV